MVAGEDAAAEDKMENKETVMWIVIALAILIFFSGFGMMGGYGYGGMVNMMYGSYGTGATFFGWIYGILIVVALVLFIIWIARRIQAEK